MSEQDREGSFGHRGVGDTPEGIVRRAIASGGVTPEERQELLSVARGHCTVEEAMAAAIKRYGAGNRDALQQLARIEAVSARSSERGESRTSCNGDRPAVDGAA